MNNSDANHQQHDEESAQQNYVAVNIPPTVRDDNRKLRSDIFLAEARDEIICVIAQGVDAFAAENFGIFGVGDIGHVR